MFLLVILVAIGAPGCPNKQPAPAPVKDKVIVADPKTEPELRSPDVSALKVGDVVPLPFIFWGGDAATFHANGGLETKAGSIFDQQGLKFKLVSEPGDSFEAQVKKYKEGTSPFLRGTMSMLGQVADDLGSDSRTKPVVFLQMTWSAGDHLVARSTIRLLSDLKGKTIALQKGGPHVGMLHDVLRTAKLDRHKDITVKWTDDVEGDKGPAALFRKDPTIDACFTISPEMADLTGGLEKTGDGTKETIKGVHVLVSTAHMSRSIADVYACRKDYFDKNQEAVQKFAAGYLKACEELIAMKKENGAAYKTLLSLTQTIYNKDKLERKEPLLNEESARGLIDDATFVGLHGNIRFFTERGNLSGFEGKQRAALDTALAEGDIKVKKEFHKVAFDYNRIKDLGGLASKALPAERFPKNLSFLPQDTIYSFIITFDADQSKFPAERYGADFARALEMASLFGKSGIEVRGHADSTNMLDDFVKTGVEMKVLRREANGDVSVVKGDARFDITNMNMKQVRAVMDQEKVPSRTRDYLQTLSEKRAKEVRDTVESFASTQGLTLDKSQIRSQGAGAFEPAVAKLKMTEAEMAKNRRVEFRIIRLRDALVSDGGFDD